MALNTNIGPERVEVTPKPIGQLLVQGSSTAITSLIIATSKSDAPLNAPTTVTSLVQFEQLFGTEAQVGEAYLSVRGFYENAGTGAELIIVAVNPSGVSGSILEQAQNEAPRTIMGALGSLKDSGLLIEDLELTAYTSATGLVQLDFSAASQSDLSGVKAGDLLRDAEGRLHPIVAISSPTSVLIASNLDAQMTKTAQGISAASASGLQIIRLYADGKFDSKTLLQEKEQYGAGITASVLGKAVTLVGYDVFLNDVKPGDVIKDSASVEFVVTSIIDSDTVEVDRLGFTSGLVTLFKASKTKVVSTTKGSGDLALTLGVAPYEVAAGEAKFLLASSSDLPAEDILAGHFLAFSDGSEHKITANKIVASSTQLVAPLAGPISYAAVTGIVTFPVATTLVTDGVVAGDVLVDSNGKEYVLQEVLTETTARIKKNLASPSPLAGAKIQQGALKLSFSSSVDLSLKLATGPSPDTSGELLIPANLFLVSAQASMESESYFVAEPSVEAIDFIGSEATKSGLRALDSVDAVNLIAIPGIYDPSVQAALVDYCSVLRNDCFGLLAIPDFIQAASIDQLLVSNLSISTVQASDNGTIVSFVGTPDLSEVAAYDILAIGGQKFTVKAVVDTEYKLVLFTTTSIPTVGAITISKPSAISWKDVIINKPSTKVSWYYNHLLVLDSQGSQAIIDPVGHVAGIMARVDANIAQGGVSHAPAGIGLAQIAGTIGLQLEISERVDAGPLRLAFINRITSSTGNGRYVFGAYTAGGATVTPDEQLIQVIRSLLFVKTSLERGLIGFIWENNSPVNRQSIENAILTFLRANSYLFPAGLPEDQQFRVEGVTPDDLALAKGLVEVKVQVRFNTAIRFISIDLEFPLPTQQ